MLRTALTLLWLTGMYLKALAFIRFSNQRGLVTIGDLKTFYVGMVKSTLTNRLKRHEIYDIQDLFDYFEDTMWDEPMNFINFKHFISRLHIAYARSVFDLSDTNDDGQLDMCEISKYRKSVDKYAQSCNLSHDTQHALVTRFINIEAKILSKFQETDSMFNYIYNDVGLLVEAAATLYLVSEWDQIEQGPHSSVQNHNLITLHTGQVQCSFRSGRRNEWNISNDFYYYQ